jgi:uncharacterized membrane protein YfcA
LGELLGTSDAVILVGTAAASAALSAVVGMAGGITLLAVMLLYLDPLVAIPLHGVVQLASNSSRAVVQRSHVHWPAVARFGLLLLPFAFAGLALARSLPAEALRLLIGVFVLVATWRPAWLRVNPGGAGPERQLVAVGGAVGFLSTTIGATGPLMAPFFLDLGLTRQGLVGTKAACQTLQHTAKLVVFGVAGFAFSQWAGLLATLTVAVVVGTVVGSRLLEHVSETTFRRLYMGVLTVIALRLVLAELGAFVFG